MMLKRNDYIGVLGGGGSLGCDTIGKLKKLQPNYDKVICTSTGALMGGLVLLKKFDILEEAYTSVTQKSIFNVNPFNKDGSIKKANFIWRFLLGKITIGESKKLIGLVKKYFTEEDYKLIKEIEKDFVVVVQEVSTKCQPLRNSKKYVSIYDYDYETFCKYIAASASVPFVFSIVEIDGRFYVDGGLTETVALKKATSFNPGKIDVFTHDPKPISKLEIERSKNNPEPTKEFSGMMEFAIDVFTIQRTEIQQNDLDSGIDINSCKEEVSEINIYYLADGVDFNKMVFDPELMKMGIDLGYQSV